MIDLVCIVFGC